MVNALYLFFAVWRLVQHDNAPVVAAACGFGVYRVVYAGNMRVILNFLYALLLCAWHWRNASAYSGSGLVSC
jgi:hypothetical protein